MRDYCSGFYNEALKRLIEEMEEEQLRAAREKLTERELAVFDLLTKPSPTLTKAQEIEVKNVARDLLQKLQEHLVARWEQNSQTRAAVQSTIRFKLNDLPEEPYPEPLWNDKVDAVWQFVYHHMSAAAAGPAHWR